MLKDGNIIFISEKGTGSKKGVEKLFIVKGDL